MVADGAKIRVIRKIRCLYMRYLCSVKNLNLIFKCFRGIRSREFYRECAAVEARLRPILYRIAVSLRLMKPYSLHNLLAQSHSLFSFLSPLYRVCQSAVTLCQCGKCAGCVWPQAFRQSDNLTTISVTNGTTARRRRRQRRPH